MPMMSVKPFADAAPKGSGVSLSRVVRKRGAFFQLTLSADAQETLFGRKLTPGKDALSLLVNSDPGQTHLLMVQLAKVDAADAVVLTGGLRGSVSAKCAQWAAADGAAKIPAVRIEKIGERGEVRIFRLPLWARPVEVKPGAARG